MTISDLGEFGLVEGRHFRRDWSGPADIGAKAAAQNLADIAAMGADPVALLVGFAAPGDLAVAWALDLVAGLAAECARVGATVVGGDVSGAETILLAVTALGDLGGRAPVTRSGARPGDVLAYAGVLGESAAGQALLEAGLTEPATLIAAHRRPAPPYPAGPEAAALGATAATALGRPGVLDWVLTGGEDHALAATFPAGRALPSHWTVIGQVRAGQGVLVNGSTVAGRAGWNHFSD